MFADKRNEIADLYGLFLNHTMSFYISHIHVHKLMRGGAKLILRIKLQLVLKPVCCTAS